MAHQLDYQTGKPAIAYIGETPWHQLGSRLQPGADLLTWQTQAGLDWTAERTTVNYDWHFVDVDGNINVEKRRSDDNIVLYRSDTGNVLSIVSDRYKPVQPRQIIEFYRDLTEKYGFELETAGSLKDGRKIWALANTKNVVTLRGDDTVKGYLLLATSFDGSMATQARFTSVRVVCNNTISIATQGRADVTVPHSTSFNADQVKIDLKLGDAWAAFSENAQKMTQRIVDKEETTRFLLDVYYNIANDDDIRRFKQENDKAEETMKKFNDRMVKALFDSPGAHLASARGTLWGVLNAVTRDIDFNAPARSQENRLNAAWFGKGGSIKDKAWAKALAMVA
jgi:phage/plasmid-like protein (TIGR03299 family)